MKYTEETWKNRYKAVASRLAPKGKGPSDGIVCAIATLEYIKDGLVADKVKSEADVKKSLVELVASLQAKNADGTKISMAGFASNASAAMKAAGMAVAGADEILNMD